MTIEKLAAQDMNYYPLKSSQNVLDFLPRIRHWLEALEDPKSRFSRWQVAKDLIDLAMLVAYDDGQQIGKIALARELKKKIRSKPR